MAEILHDLRQKTGLSQQTIAELLSSGWRYVDNLGEISRWEHPMWRIEKPNIDPGDFVADIDGKIVPISSPEFEEKYRRI